MKKILVSVFLLVFGLCLAGCETIVEYASLSSITKDEEFTSAYLSSVNGDAQVLPVDFDDLKEKEFYKNIMNSSAKPTDVLPEVVPMWSLVIKSDSNQLVIDNLGNLYAEFNDNWYHILCSENDYVALDEFLFPTDSNLTIADIIDTLEFDEVTLKKGDLSLGFVKKFNDLKNQSFYNNLMKVKVFALDSTLDKDMPDVDYYLNFYNKDSEDIFSIKIYGVYNINDDYVYCEAESNVTNDLYEFTLTSELFNQIYDYFSWSSKIEVAKFEEIKDIELLSFYNETMVINSVDGFPYIITTDDLHTSQQLTRVHERYNEEFFEHYALMIIAFDTCSTEEIIGINDIKFDGEKFIAIFDVTGFPITDDISTRHFVFKINKLAFQNMDKQSYQVDIKVNNLDNIGSGSAYYDEYFTPVENIVDKTYVYEYEGFGGPFNINIFSDGTFMYYVGMLSSYIGRGNWEYTNGILTLTDGQDQPQFINKFYVKDNCLIYIAEGSTNFMYLKVSDGAKFNVLTIKEEVFYKLTIHNDSSNELIGIKEEYKAGEEVEVKMEYDMAIETYVFLNGELLGTLNGSNSLKFNMPDKDSSLVLTYTNAEIYKVNVIDNFGLLIIPLKQYYAPGETVQVITKFLSGPSIDVKVDGQFLEVKEAATFGYYGYEFIMPEKDVEIAILYNGLINQPCEENAHKWDEGKHQQVPGGGHDELVYTCEYCGYHKYVDFTYEMQIEELTTIVENELKTLNTEKIIIKDLIKMLEDIFVEYDLTDTQIKEIEVCVSVLEKLDEFDEITKEELEELYKNPDISDNVE